MGKNTVSTLLLMARTRKAKTCHILFAERVKGAARTARFEVVRALQDIVRVLRITIFLHSAKDFSSVLRLYGIDEPSRTE